jgi:SAM-dependent methyltransferase
MPARTDHFDPPRGLDLEPYLRAGNVGAAHRLIRYVWAHEVLVESGIAGGVVDLGCGTGYGTHALARRLRHLRFVGVDAHAGALDRARTREPLPNLELRLAEPPRWGAVLGEGAFGGVLCFDVLHRIEHPELLLEAVVRTMPPGGWFLASAPCASDEPRCGAGGVQYSPSALHDLLSRYFGKLLTPDAGTLPQRQVFDRLRGTRAEYLLRLNPVIGQAPIVPANPFRP